jgi:DNA-directed RNA polymerase delta subunit
MMKMSSSPASTTFKKMKMKYYQMIYSLEALWNKNKRTMQRTTIWNPLSSSGSTKKSQLPHYLMNQWP